MRVIANGVNLLKAQDFSSRLKKTGQRNADDIVELFNRMMEQLKDERLRLREQNEFLDLLINASPMGVVVLDFDGFITEINPSGERILCVSREEYLGVKVQALSGVASIDISVVPRKSTATLNRSDGQIFKCTHASFVDRGFKRSFYLIEHLTDELRKAEKKAYEQVIRMMAHEVNNSTAGITSILDTATSMLQEDNKYMELADALTVCMNRCYSMSDFVSRLAEVVKVPKAILRPYDLNQLLLNQHSLFESLTEGKDIDFVFDLDEEMKRVRLDAPLMEQVVINIVKNSIESIEQKGTITIRTSAEKHLIEVVDNGAGIPKEAEGKLFSPFFSTKPQGQGIGLLFIQEVLGQHGFSYRLQTDPLTGLTHFTIQM